MNNKLKSSEDYYLELRVQVLALDDVPAITTCLSMTVLYWLGFVGWLIFQ